MSESLPNVQIAPERVPPEAHEAARAAAAVVAEEFAGQIDGGQTETTEPTETGITVGQALAAAGADEPEPQSDVTEVDEAADESAPEYAPLDYEPPESVLAELDESDLEAEAEAEVEAELEAEESEYGYDTRERELRKRLKIAEKRAEHERELRVRGERKNWVAEAEHVFPYSVHGLEGIKATSRRDFLRQARDLHDHAITMLRTYGGVPKVEEIKANLEKARQEAKDDAAKAFGPPAAGPGGPVVDKALAEAEYAKAAAEAKRSGSLTGLFKAKMKFREEV